MIDLKSISPKAGAKYSPNLYRWLRHFKRSGYSLEGVTVFVAEDGRRYIGHRHDGAVIGSSLHGVLVDGGRAGRGCYLGSGKWKELKTFWRQYIRLGRCHIDPKHETSFLDERWDAKETKRTCLWCGLEQRRIARKKTVVYYRWVTTKT